MPSPGEGAPRPGSPLLTSAAACTPTHARRCGRRRHRGLAGAQVGGSRPEVLTRDAEEEQRVRIPPPFRRVWCCSRGSLCRLWGVGPPTLSPSPGFPIRWLHGLKNLPQLHLHVLCVRNWHPLPTHPVQGAVPCVQRWRGQGKTQERGGRTSLGETRPRGCPGRPEADGAAPWARARE